ncbi:TetR/AcrR family transcriptional regulator [Microbacterium sp. cx-59]|uniref:TetR/AcrR family transcriptional regulator n=1 Tax=Microbacterium sp. cx-59 TaxID=2891207 RepID=UPI001E2C71F0|nr:TetR/AcrR family transcriptional regulator [Microbacterium sp. cx-59]MCC4909274.1 TetR/AcrR family transcriptional regulator [Microbacterium sp. cx-59]
MVQRGSYAKGVAKREQILHEALAVIAREGYRGASVREIADAVGLSQAGLLHYFDSKEELFVEILRVRDRVDVAALGGETDDAADLGALTDGYLRIIRHNTDVPGLVQLFAQMASDAADPQHPAHAYFLERGAMFRSGCAAAFARAQSAGTVTDRVAPETIARTLQAVWDGAQMQWLLDSSVDVAGIVGAYLHSLAPAPEGQRA